MGWMHFVVILAIFGAVWCDDTRKEDSLEEDDRETRQYNQEGWRVSESFHKGSPGWIPRGGPLEPLDLKLKRRRLRKRKRKPQPVEQFRDDEEIFIKRFHPQRLDQIREPWEEMDEEAARNPTIRRRITPVYYSPQSIDRDLADMTPNPGSERIAQYSSGKSGTEPTLITSSIRVEDQTVQMKPEPKVNPLAGLKSLLKKSGGNISLSEILQQRNLSLSELLRGGEHAISVLTEKPLAVTTPTKIVYATDTAPITKYKRLPPSVALMKTTDRSYVQHDQSSETLTDEETLQAQRKRFTLLQSKENKLFSPVNRMEVITEQTSEREKFVTSYPKYFTSPQLVSESSSRSTPSPTSTTAISINSTTSTPKIIITTASETPKEIKINKLHINNEERNNLPTTNAKLRLTTKKVSVNEDKSSYPSVSVGFPEPIKISVNEILGFGYNKEKETNEDAPMRVSIDLEEFIEENKAIYETPLLEEHTTAGVVENQTYVTARKEIMEVLEDPVSRDKLSRILENRNMTLNELVEQRERGSSQLHLADIFHNSTKEPEPKEEPLVGQIMAESFQSFPVLTRKSKSRTFDEGIGNKFLPANRSIEQPDLVTNEPEEPSRTETTETKADVNAPPFPWKQLYPDLFTDSEEKDADSRGNELEEGLGLERLDHTSSLSSVEQLTPDEYDLFLQIPPGVKSTLFVSLAIIGLSLVVFLTLLVVFRWTQKKNRATNYCSGLSSKMGSPIIVKGHPSNALRSFVGDKVKRKKNFFKSNMQSMSDDIWESSRDRKPSF